MKRGGHLKTLEYVMANVAVSGGCLIWRRSIDARGIPTMTDAGKKVSVRRWIFSRTVAPLAKDSCIVDTCGKRTCIEPRHLLQQASPLPPSQVQDVRQRLTAGTTRRGSCLEFASGSSRVGGYGVIWHNGRNQAAHRVSYSIHVGPIPDGAVIRHKCDNPPCINPDHLVAGTQADNMRDRFERGRANTARGSSVGSSKLAEWQAAEIRTWVGLGLSSRALASRYGVTRSTISSIARNETWRHVRPAPASFLTPWVAEAGE